VLFCFRTRACICLESIRRCQPALKGQSRKAAHIELCTSDTFLGGQDMCLGPIAALPSRERCSCPYPQFADGPAAVACVPHRSTSPTQIRLCPELARRVSLDSLMQRNVAGSSKPALAEGVPSPGQRRLRESSPVAFEAKPRPDRRKVRFLARGPQGTLFLNRRRSGVGRDQAGRATTRATPHEANRWPENRPPRPSCGSASSVGNRTPRVTGLD